MSFKIRVNVSSLQKTVTQEQFNYTRTCCFSWDANSLNIPADCSWVIDEDKIVKESPCLMYYTNIISNETRKKVYHTREHCSSSA